MLAARRAVSSFNSFAIRKGSDNEVAVRYVGAGSLAEPVRLHANFRMPPHVQYAIA